MSDQKIVIGAELKLDSAQSLESVGKVKQAFREAQKALHAAQEEFGEFSKEAVRAAKYVAQLKDRIGDANSLVDAFNPDRKFQAFSQSINAVTGGFSAVQGAMGLFGVQSENVEQMLLRVQSAMALSQGLNSVLEAKDAFKILATNIRNSTIVLKANEFANKAAAGAMKLFGVAVETTSFSFKALKVAIVATGIGILLVLIGELLPRIQSWISGTSGAEAAQKKLNEALERQQELLKDDLSLVEGSEKIATLRAKIAGKTEAEITKIHSNANTERVEVLKKNYESLDAIARDGEERKLEDQQKANKAASDAYKDYLTELQKQDIESLEDQVKNKEKKDQLKKEENNKTEEKNKKRIADEKKKVDELKRIHDQEISDAKKLIEDLSKENEVGRGKTEQEKELIKLAQEYDQKRAVLVAGEQSLYELEILFAKQKSDIQQKYYNEQQQKQKEANDKKVASDKEAEEKRLELHNNTIQGIIAASQTLATDEAMSSDSRRQSLEIAAQSILDNTEFTEEERTRILQAFSNARKQIDDIEAQHKADTVANVGSLLGAASELAGKNTAAGKALAIAETTISTYTAAQKAYQSQMTVPDPSAPVRAAIAAAAAIAQGLVRVKAILSVKVPGASGGSGSISGIGSAPVQPSVPGNAVTTLDRNSINAIGNQAIKAFVIETDVTNNQEKIARINRAARIG